MPFKIVRNDITKMNTEAIVNTANTHVTVGTGCDFAVYTAAGYDELLAYRKIEVGEVPEGEVFITPGFNLPAKHIIHAVSPCYIDGNSGEEDKLRSCYKKSLALARDKGIKSIAFPLISTGGFGYPKEEGMRIAVDEINAFLMKNQMDIVLVVFGNRATRLGENLSADFESFIDQDYVEDKQDEEYGDAYWDSHRRRRLEGIESLDFSWDDEAAVDKLNKDLKALLDYEAETFSEQLLSLIKLKGMTNAEVYNRAIVGKRYFSKLNTNKNFHPDKTKALCLCVGARLSLEETKDLLARAGYALSPCDYMDRIFSYFIEHKHYDVIDIDIQLEENGLPCIIS